MRFIITPKVTEKYPELKIGLLVIRNLDNTQHNPEIMKLLREQEKTIRVVLNGKALADEPKIVDWKEAYRAFGAKPKKHRSSIEALLRRVKSMEALPNINTLVNLYNLVSIKHMLPVGGDDLDNVNGSIKLAIAAGTEPFTVLGSQETTHPNQGEIIYHDEKEVLCRRWNWRECEKTKMTEETTNVCLVIEGLTSTTQEELEEAMQELQKLVTTHCGGTAQTYVITREKKEIEI